MSLSNNTSSNSFVVEQLDPAQTRQVAIEFFVGLGVFLGVVMVVTVLYIWCQRRAAKKRAANMGPRSLSSVSMTSMESDMAGIPPAHPHISLPSLLPLRIFTLPPPYQNI